MTITRYALPVALLAAAPMLIASPAGAEEMDMSTSGYELDFELPKGVEVFADVAVGAYLARDEYGEKIERTSVKSDGELGFSVNRTIFNGLVIIADAAWNLDIESEHYAIGLGGGFGEIRAGSEANIAERLHVGVPNFVPHSAVSIDSGDIYPSSNLSAQRSTYIEADTLLIVLDGNSGQIVGTDVADPNTLTYSSTEVGGFRVGFSYIPDLDDTGQANQSNLIPDADTASPINAATILAARYDGNPLGEDAIGISFSLGYMDAETDEAGLEPQAASGALQVRAGGGITLGASYFESSDLGRELNDKSKVWIAGISYEAGSVTMGVAYRKSRTQYDYDSDPTVGGVEAGYRGYNEAFQVGMIYDTGQRYNYGIELRHIRDRNNLSSADPLVAGGAAGRWDKSYSGAFVLSIAY